MPKSVLWSRDEHTECKHKVLGFYLDGWFPILGSQTHKLLFVDGFAGPGEYDGGEPGSPLIALDSVRKAKDAGRLGNVEIVFLFVERDPERADHLRQVLKSRTDPPKTQYHVLDGDFKSTMSKILDHLDETNRRMAPSFFMIDPFGVKGNSMDLIARIVKNPRSELFVSFMYEPIRRFKKTPVWTEHLTTLFGTDEWKRVLGMGETDESKRFLHSLFSKQLKRHGSKFVVPFEIWNGGRHLYTIYFCTGHRKGCDLMKASIWRVGPRGTFELRAHADQRLDLFEKDTEPLCRQLKAKFGSHWVPTESVDDFVMGDETPFHKGHLRGKTLVKMLRDGRLEKDPSDVRGFPARKGVRVRFL